MIRLGLCCKFLRYPVAFRDATATAVLKLGRSEALQKLSGLCLHNANALHEALQFCADNGIGDFRVNSRILPLKTHPSAGYAIGDLSAADEIIERFREAGAFARNRDLRLTFHPDPFVVLNSPDPDVVVRSVAELEYQAEVAAWIGADVINLHAGGVYGDSRAALVRLRRTWRSLPSLIRRRLTLENDDRSYTPRALLPFCEGEGIPFVYDVHHHRCLPDGLSVDDVTARAMRTWDREPLFHVSSPRSGRCGGDPRPHADYIAPGDVPACWCGLNVTVEVEAKAKDLAVLRLRRWLLRQARVPR
ncbi:MAG: UV damage repair endonuclease UvsE [Lentisphaerae bacterium RIFOXYB12_FULL_65_16]|nr:MAG: UV damage repair endonuclease UvsE [Lentisphaerae bacterium RIFOXYA12_64_32]OGV89294.1 MAG: UV damage repair endonuclease UvsE [Lentisphaerae bacterium RIFOXYB12_FULL_65_16]